MRRRGDDDHIGERKDLGLRAAKAHFRDILHAAYANGAVVTAPVHQADLQALVDRLDVRFPPKSERVAARIAGHAGRRTGRTEPSRRPRSRPTPGTWRRRRVTLAADATLRLVGE